MHSENIPSKTSLIIFSGLPGAGKSSIADAISKKLTIPVFSKDSIEATLVRSKLAEINDERLGFFGYELLTELAKTCLKNGISRT